MDSENSYAFGAFVHRVPVGVHGPVPDMKTTLRSGRKQSAGVRRLTLVDGTI
jgi:hypothetical protein